MPSERLSPKPVADVDGISERILHYGQELSAARRMLGAPDSKAGPRLWGHRRPLLRVQVAPSAAESTPPDRTVTDIACVSEVMLALRDAEARADICAHAMGWWAARFDGQVARATQAEARARRLEDALDHTCLRAVHAERELEAAEAAICRERTPIFNGTERLTIADRIRWLGDKQTDANELGAVDSALRGERVPLIADDGGALTRMARIRWRPISRASAPTARLATDGADGDPERRRGRLLQRPQGLSAK
jgi:hypothetical protein